MSCPRINPGHSDLFLKHFRIEVPDFIYIVVTQSDFGAFAQVVNAGRVRAVAADFARSELYRDYVQGSDVGRFRYVNDGPVVHGVDSCASYLTGYVEVSFHGLFGSNLPYIVLICRKGKLELL